MIAPASFEKLADRLRTIVGPRGVLTHPAELLTYAADGLPTYRRRPPLAVFPASRAELVRVVQALHAEGRGFVPRGAGTGLSGGALADPDTVLIGLNRLDRILAIDAEDRLALVEPGVVNARLTKAVLPFGLHYAPDPSSQTACTIGGNVAENAGGPHCLKYGVTLNHVAAATIVLPNGELVSLGSTDGDTDDYDLLGAFVGSEGCFGIAADVTVRLTRNPEAVHTLLADFMAVEDAARAVSDIIASGIVPAALEMMDNGTIRAVEASIYAAGYPIDAAAVLLAEVDGLSAGLDEDVETISAICTARGARDVLVAGDAAARARLWQGRKKAFGAMGRVAPELVVQDAVVPRTRLPDILASVAEIAGRHQVQVCNVFHAGDGNLHPNIPYDGRDTEVVKRVHLAMREIMEACLEAGGSVTGEHGIGVDKLDYMPLAFSPESLAAMCALRGVFDPLQRANPSKVVPVRSCREWRAAPSARESIGGGGWR
ncbi:MAG TPA: FAD-linked oxidase C-terminal domain-containing protein [Gemmatimonadaceae bacterium]|nr:FAD-linked oxidase C-terminal domain-containing protein [Gemmatimonadaceae bacterium]